MSENETAASTPHVAHEEPNYMLVWLYLFILTMAEVGVVYMKFLGAGVIAACLVIMALAKAALVAAYFMHLKFENRTLAMIAVTPLVLCTFLLLMLVPDTRGLLGF